MEKSEKESEEDGREKDARECDRQKQDGIEKEMEEKDDSKYESDNESEGNEDGDSTSDEDCCCHDHFRRDDVELNSDAEKDEETVNKLIDRLRGTIWKRVAADCFRQLIEYREGPMENEIWQARKSGLDCFWVDIEACTGSGSLAYSRYHYWESLSMKEDVTAGSVGIALMSASCTEACCERAFSILRKIFSKQRRKLSVDRLNDLITVRESTFPTFSFIQES
jgi:hypothetical protein